MPVLYHHILQGGHSCIIKGFIAGVEFTFLLGDVQGNFDNYETFSFSVKALGSINLNSVVQ